MMDFINNFIDNFIDDHPFISSIIEVIIVFLVIIAAIGLILFNLWLNGVSEIAITIILYSLGIICVIAMISL